MFINSVCFMTSPSRCQKKYLVLFSLNIKKVVVVETAYANTLGNLDQKTNAVTATEEAAAGYKASQDG